MSGGDEPRKPPTEEWEPPTVFELLPGDFTRTEAQHQVLYHVALFAILGTSLGLVFGAIELIHGATDAPTGVQSGVSATGMIISGYLMTLMLSPFLALISGVVTAHSLESSHIDRALVSGVGSTLGFIALLGILFLGGELVGGQPGNFSNSITAQPLNYLPYTVGIAFASGGGAFATSFLLHSE